VSLLRSKSGEYGISLTNLGALGFSAGAHLVARLGAQGDRKKYAKVDAIDEFSSCPNFAALIYPAYLYDKGTGTVPPEVLPRPGMPPVFLAESKDDPYFCILEYAKNLESSHVPYRVEEYESGGHGYGLRLDSSIPASRWPIDAADWLRSQLR
jgi:acetyl esterase/lipase